ncbi:MAG: GTP-binding protein [Nitrospira sp.]|nr:GTP-binding protein [Nitrospira sp.]
MVPTPVPFYMLCGSLGAGKTTLLMRLLEYWKAQGRKTGVLMNEAGEISIDGPRAGTLAEQVMNLAGGCVCCDTKDDLSWGIAELVRSYRSDVLILECSGLADPAEVIDAVTDLYTARLASLERVIALLHPVSTESSHSAAYVATQAIRCADELILNKQDLYVPGHWEQFRASIVEKNPFARLWETSHARLDVATLLNTRPILDSRVSPPRHTTTNVLFDTTPPSSIQRAAYHPIATTIRLPGPLNQERFVAWLHNLPPGLERAKGFFRFTGKPELQEFQYAPPGKPTVSPVMLLDEPDPAIVLIGRDYDVEALSHALLNCVETAST